MGRFLACFLWWSTRHYSMIGIYCKHLLDVTLADKSHPAAQPWSWQLPLFYKFIDILTGTAKKNSCFRKGQVLLLLEFHRWFNSSKEILLSFSLALLRLLSTFLWAVLLHSVVCGENLTTISTFSGLWHTCNINGFNIPFCCTSPQVITSKLSTTFVNLFHDIAFLKSGSKKRQLL